jgi:hypothetical protein
MRSLQRMLLRRQHDAICYGNLHTGSRADGTAGVQMRLRLWLQAILQPDLVNRHSCHFNPRIKMDDEWRYVFIHVCALIRAPEEFAERVSSACAKIR